MDCHKKEIKMSQFVLTMMGILAITMWIGYVVFVVFSWKMMMRQNQVFSYILARLDKMDEYLSARPKNVQETSLSITKDEPLSKYQDVTLPDGIDISFVEKA